MSPAFILLISTSVITHGHASAAVCQGMPLLEISYDASGMLFPSGKYLYFRACANRTIQYEVQVSLQGHKQMRTERLTRPQFAAITALVDSEQFKRVNGAFGGKRNIDYALTLRVQARHGTETQTFQTLSLPTANGENAIPRPALALFCLVDNLRKTDLKLSTDCHESARRHPPTLTASPQPDRF